MMTAERATEALIEETRHEPALAEELGSRPGGSPVDDLARFARGVASNIPGQEQARVGWLGRELDERLARAEAPEDRYALACRSALVHALLGHRDAAYQALRVAAGVDDSWARHHHFYGLVHALGGDEMLARFELQLAFDREPFASTRERIAGVLHALSG